MKVSRSQLSSTVNVFKYFKTMDEVYLYFVDHPEALISGIYCAIGGDPASTDYSLAVWELMLYNGLQWLAVLPTSGYNLTITNDGLKALTNAEKGQYVLSISEVKVLAETVSDPATPLIYWTDTNFTDAGEVVLDFSADTDSTHWGIDRLKYRTNLANGGLQITFNIFADDYGPNLIANYWVGTIGLYVKDQRAGHNEFPVLFGIVSLPSAIYKTATSTTGGTGNSLTFYINTVLDNLGTVLDVSVLPSETSSVPEVVSELYLNKTSSELADPYNLVLVDNLYSSGTPAIAVRRLSSSTGNFDWVYFTPNENSISLPASSFSSDVQNYMFVYFDTASQLYKRADGDHKDKSAIGVRVGNSVVFSGTVRNNVSSYKYQLNYSISGGTGYSVGDILQVAGTDIIVNVTAVNANGTITSADYSPLYGTDSDNPLTGAALTYYKYVSTKAGSGATLTRTRTAFNNYNWNFTSAELNQPLYVDTGDNAGKATTTKTESFIGWCLDAQTIRLGLDAKTEATSSEYGVVRYATGVEVAGGETGSASVSPASDLVISPKDVQDNYLQKTIKSGQPGSSDSNRITIDTYCTFSKCINSTVSTGDVAFQGTAYRAYWADLAEYYHSDKIYLPGTLVTIGAGSEEITEASVECNGIISTRPGYELGTKDSERDLPVALCGKVPVLMDRKSAVNFGDKIYLSKEVPGRASTREFGKCLGKVIDKDPAGKESVMCSVRIEF